MTIVTPAPSSNDNDSPSFFDRVISNDSTRKGLAAAAGILIGVISEAIWPKG